MNTASTQPTTILKTIPTTDADEILMTMTTPQTRTTKPKGLSHATFTGTTYGSIPSRDESTTLGASTTPFDRNDENRVEVDHDHYIVAGTKIYVDSRVDGAHITREDNPFEEDPPSDPFAIEREFRKSRKVHGTRNRRVNAAKGLPGIKRTRGFVKSVMIRKIGEDIDMPSNAKMIKNGNGKMVERRETMRAGKKITVVLSNPALYGHDLIAKPGSVVNGKIVDENGILRTKAGGKASKSHAVRTEIRSPHSPDETLVPFIQNSILIDSDKNELVLPPLTTDDELNEELLEEMKRAQVLEGDTERIDIQVTPMKTTAEKLAESCFAARRHTLLVGVDSIERKTGVSHLDCLRLCSDSSKDCQSIVYHDIFSVCDMFDARDGVGKAELLPATGKYYYEPIKEVKHCMDTSCSAGEEPLFARSQAMRNPYPLQSDLVLRLNEDDCVFVCLTNSTLDSKEVSCATVQFDAFMQQCILSPSPTAHPLTRSISSNFYEKLCVSMSSARLCSGGTVDRRSQYILLGFLRDARTMPSPAACLDTCITASTNLGFQCYSVMYYYEEEKLNCILNDASAVTQPAALKKEDDIAVDYFGVDECFGMKEAESNRRPTSKNAQIAEEGDENTEDASSLEMFQFFNHHKMRSLPQNHTIFQTLIPSIKSTYVFVEVSPALRTVVVDLLGRDESRRTDDAVRGGGLGWRGLQGRC
ncbi:hypothetical protein WR25_11887 [Diploscapter pachys]|uniref:Apple domain-containing protein n=1 Tax=Diploscapter pachys TaxID=2018661 RepID=A0A2A2JB04_9BILA|nr:hypothetical protein WR25_11887 [Diploscapter pachys]